MAWSPHRYLAYSDERLRPAQDLLARIDADPAEIVDLGCGTGSATRLLLARWPRARVEGVDSSAEMLAAARQAPDLAAVRWRRADIAAWRPQRAPGLIFSNAALHWLDDHDALLPRLLAAVAPGGVLAVQMPRNHDAPSHTCIAEAVAAGPWAARLRPLLRPSPVAAPEAYHHRLAPLAARLDVWETTYLHVLHGRNPVAQWTRSTVLAPLAAALEEPERSAFLADYANRVLHAYPPRPDGTTLFPFRRLFIVARRAGV